MIQTNMHRMSIHEFHNHVGGVDGYVILNDGMMVDGELYKTQEEAVSAMNDYIVNLFACTSLGRAALQFPRTIAVYSGVSSHQDYAFEIQVCDAESEDGLIHESYYDNVEEFEHDSDLLHDYFHMER